MIAPTRRQMLGGSAALGADGKPLNFANAKGVRTAALGVARADGVVVIDIDIGSGER